MTDVKLVKDCGLYPSYKKIIDFTGTKSEIITKQLSWINSFEHLDIFDNVNYNKFGNKLVLPMDYSEALTYTYAVLSDITGTDGNPKFFFIEDVENLTNGIEDAEPNVAFYLMLDPIMTFMGDYELDECMVNRCHVDRWSDSSAKPIYVTPNAEGVDAFNKYVTAKKLTNPDHPNFALCVITFASPYLRYKYEARDPTETGHDYHESTLELKDAVYAASFLVDISDITKKVKSKLTANFEWWTGFVSYYGKYDGIVEYPSLKEVIDGTFQSNLPVVDGSIVAFTLVPLPFVKINSTVVEGETCYYLGENSATLDIYWNGSIDDPFPSTFEAPNVGSLLISQDYIPVSFIISHSSREDPAPIDLSSYAIVEFKDLSNVVDDITQITLNASEWLVPEKPTDGAIADSKYEPMLYMQPYVTRKIVKGDGTVVQEIPDTNFTDTTFTLRTIITAGTTSTMFLHGTDFEDVTEGEVAFDNSAVLDVVNDQWKTYLYTKRDTDRQILSNNIWRQSLDNLFYMSYGGALVGSRSSTAQPLANPMMVGAASGYNPYASYWAGSQVNGTLHQVAAPGSIRGSPALNLTGAGKRLVGATGLAAAASVATSLLDAHFMWENQKQVEKQIRNEPTRLEMVGDGISTIMIGLRDYYIVVMKVDDINYERAYQNFRKYGYMINKFTKPNLHSRKLFNYILTNGAIIKGAINQHIREAIGSIYDSGVTIFHYDSGDESIRKLQYSDKENIEVSLTNNRTKYYTVKNVLSNHTIHAEFEDNPRTKNYTISNVQDNHNIHAEFELE